MSKIIICGDSFCSADTGKPSTHFSELINNKYQVINLARGGASNTVICLQIKKAVELQPSLIIFNTTDSNRTEFVVNDYSVRDISLKDIIYPYSSDSSFATEHVGGLNARYMSDVWASIIEPRSDNLLKYTDDKLKLLRTYFAELFDEPLKQIIDQWIFGFWKSQLDKFNIPYIEISNNGIGQELYQYCRNNLHKVNQAVYHTDEETQKNFASKLNVIIRDILE